MNQYSYDRRTVLRLGAGAASLAATATLAGCQQAPVIGNGGDGGGDGTGAGGSGDGGTIAAIPARSQFVLDADVEGILGNQAFRQSVNDILAQGGLDAGPTSVEGALDKVEGALGADPRKLTHGTFFFALQASAPPYVGVNLATEWSTGEVESVLQDRASDLEQQDYLGTTVYRTPKPESPWLALPGNGEISLGTKPAVTDVLDIRTGRGQAVSGRLRTAFEGTASGYVRFAGVVPDQLPREGMQPVAAQLARDTEVVSGSIARGGDRSLRVTIELADAEAATTLAGQLERGRRLARQQAATAASQYQELQDRATTVLQNTTVSRDGSTVTLRMPKGLQVAGVGVLAVVASFVLGLGESPADVPPQAAFAFEYDRPAGTLTITHEAGDAIPAAALVVRGRGFEGPVRWDRGGGSTSMEVGGEPAVAAGDNLTLESVDPEYLARVVWRSEEADSSAVLAADEGPEA